MKRLRILFSALLCLLLVLFLTACNESPVESNPHSTESSTSSTESNVSSGERGTSSAESGASSDESDISSTESDASFGESDTSSADNDTEQLPNPPVYEVVEGCESEIKTYDLANLKAFMRLYSTAFTEEYVIPVLKAETDSVCLECYMNNSGCMTIYCNVNDIRYRITAYNDPIDKLPDIPGPTVATVTVDGIEVELKLHQKGYFLGWFWAHGSRAAIIISTTDPAEIITTDPFDFIVYSPN